MLQINDLINKPGIKEIYKKFKIYNFTEDWEVKSIPSFKCRVEKNKEVEDKRVRKAEQWFPYNHQVLQFELERTNSLKIAIEELQFAIGDRQYTFPNGTVVYLID